MVFKIEMFKCAGTQGRDTDYCAGFTSKADSFGSMQYLTPEGGLKKDAYGCWGTKAETVSKIREFLNYVSEEHVNGMIQDARDF